MHDADGVFQGGGVKGLGLVGALEAFADRKRHPDKYVDNWVSVAGTSAGAIVAAYLACGHDAAQTVALAKSTPYADFCDWGPGGEIIGGGANLVLHHGLARGRVFHDWFRNEIDGKTFGDIRRAGRTLKLIAADITRREMLVLPDSIAAYRAPGSDAPIDPDAFEVADAVRMSMSIPYFFEPVQLTHHESGKVSTIVDGGVLSNFPVWIFDVAERDVVRPTFGFKLVGGRRAGTGLEGLRALVWPVGMGIDIFQTSMDAWDNYWVAHATRVRTCTIDTGDIGITDFDLSAEQQQWLLDSGEHAGDAFLGSWNPADYVNEHGRRLKWTSPTPSRPTTA